MVDELEGFRRTYCCGICLQVVVKTTNNLADISAVVFSGLHLEPG